MDGTQNILFIDDDPSILNRIELCLFHATTQANCTYRLVRMNQSGKAQLEMDSLLSLKEASNIRAFGTTGRLTHEFVFYTATDFKQAMSVVALPYIDRLTIISDLGINGTRDASLLGLLESLAYRYLPVNLVFASAENYKRHLVERLIKNKKAYFIIKGTRAWAELPYAIVQNHQAFRYQLISRHDLEGLTPITGTLPSPMTTPPVQRIKVPLATGPLEWQPPQLEANEIVSNLLRRGVLPR